MPADRVEDIKIPPIRNGTVIDHITDGQSLNVLKILGVNENNIDSSISIGIHVSTNKAGMKWKDLTKIMGALPGQYHPNASFVMPPALFFEEVLGMTDSQNNRVVVNDPQEPRKYNVLGYPVIIDANAGTDEVYFGDLKAYKFNFASDIEVSSSDEVDFRVGSRVWRALALADGKLADTNAIVRYIRAT